MRRVFAVFVLAGLGLVSGVMAGPAVFSDSSFAAARAANAEDGRVLVVKMTASWCGPCQKMNRTTWVDEAVVAWFTEKGVAVAVDVDEQPEVSSALGVRSMPTLIVFKGGEEWDRKSGYQDAGELLGWLEGLERGVTAADALRERVAAMETRAAERDDVQAVMDWAAWLARNGREVEAAREYVWLWDNMLRVDPNFLGVRTSFLLMYIEALTLESADARAVFLEIVERDRAFADPYAEGFDPERASDFVDLALHVGESETVDAWIASVEVQGGFAAVAEDFGWKGDSIANELLERERWAAAGALKLDPVSDINMQLMLAEPPIALRVVMPDVDEDLQRAMFENTVDELVEMSASWHAAMLAAGRDLDALKVVGRAATGLPDAAERVREAAIQRAVEVGEARGFHLRWIERHLQDSLVREELQRGVERLLDGGGVGGE